MKTGIYLLSLAAIFITACGGDSGTESSSGDPFARVETIYDLGECETYNEGVAKRVESEGRFYVCRKGAWQPDPDKVSSGNGSGYDYSGISSVNDGFSSSSCEDDELESSSSQDSASSVMESESEYDAIHNTLKDLRDGKTYRTMIFGGNDPQIWMAENLNYFDSVLTPSLQDGSWCYKNDESQCYKYGRFYNWEAALDACPDGWHLPNTLEWDTLVTKMGGSSIAGKNLRDLGFVDDNPVGYTKDAESEFVGSTPTFWTNTLNGGSGRETFRVRVWPTSNVYVFTVSQGESNYYIQQDEGLSVRCIKDTVFSNEINPPAEYDATNNTMKDMRDGKVYRTTQIGNQIWMAENLNYSDSARTPSLLGNTWQTQEGELSSYSERKCITGSSECRERLEKTFPEDPSQLDRCMAEEDCARLGLFYTQKAAGVACPLGWHLPYDIEWEQLIETAGGYTDAAISLRTATGWSTRGGLDSYGFSALPLYYVDRDDGFNYSADFDGHDNNAFFCGVGKKYVNIHSSRVSLTSPLYGASVRCIKNRD